MMTEQEAKQLEVDMNWNGRANVCVHCGRVPETFYIVTGHDHTDDEIRWCLCRKPLTPKKSEREAELEAEVLRLREALTLRDYFAAKAMQELARSFYADDDCDDFKVALRAMCNEAYQWADAMIKARE